MKMLISEDEYFEMELLSRLNISGKEPWFTLN